MLIRIAFGIIAGGSSLGGVILPIMVQRLIVEVGFGWSMRVAAFLILFLMIIANLTITSRMQPQPKPLDVMEFVRPLKELPFDLVALGAFLFFLGMFLPINYIILEATHYGMSEHLAQYLVSILNAASFFGRTVPGFIADKIGRFNMMFIMCIFTGEFSCLSPSSKHGSNIKQVSSSSLFGSQPLAMHPSSCSRCSSASVAAHSCPYYPLCSRRYPMSVRSV